MRHLISVAALALFPVLATAADGLDWAYPVAPRPEPLDTLVLKQVPGSERAYTQAQIDDAFNPPDWFPDEHPTMPPIVARGEKPAVRACALSCRAETVTRNRRAWRGFRCRTSCANWPPSRAAIARACVQPR